MDAMSQEARQQKIREIKEYFENRMDTWTKSCKVGLNVIFHVDKSGCSIHVNLDHLGKEEVVKLIGEGKLYEEIMILYELAHLPYAVSYVMGPLGSDDSYFHIIDRVAILLDQAFHPLHEEQYDKDKMELVSRNLLYMEEDLMPPPRIREGIAWLEEKRGQRPRTPWYKRIARVLVAWLKRRKNGELS